MKHTRHIIIIALIGLAFTLTACGTLKTQDEQAQWISAQVDQTTSRSQLKLKLGHPHRKPHDSALLIYRVHDQDHVFRSTSDKNEQYTYHGAVEEWPINAPLP